MPEEKTGVFQMEFSFGMQKIPLGTGFPRGKRLFGRKKEKNRAPWD